MSAPPLDAPGLVALARARIRYRAVRCELGFVWSGEVRGPAMIPGCIAAVRDARRMGIKIAMRNITHICPTCRQLRAEAVTLLRRALALFEEPKSPEGTPLTDRELERHGDAASAAAARWARFTRRHAAWQRSRTTSYTTLGPVRGA